MQDFQVFLAQRSQTQRFDKVHHLAQRAVDKGAVAAHLADAQLGALPQIVIVGLGNRDVELVAHAILNRAQHLALALERMIVGQEQGQAKNSNDHSFGEYTPVARLAIYAANARSRQAPASARRRFLIAEAVAYGEAAAAGVVGG